MAGGASQAAASNAQLLGAYGKLALAFEANQGQTNSAVQFLARGNGYTLFLTQGDAVLRLRGQAADVVLRMNLVGADQNSTATGLDPLAQTSNYFVGSNPSQWLRNVPKYGRVLYHNAYPGIDVAYYGNQQQLEYDFIVAPGGDPSAIRLGYDGADSMALDAAGNLVLHTAGGDVTDQAPVIYQVINGARVGVSGSYVLEGNNQVGFQLGSYDPSKPLVIDPTRVYSTYLGGSQFDAGLAIAVDSEGNAYVTGSTTSPDFPTANAMQGSPNGTPQAFIAKLDPTGSTLLYSTFLGGSGLNGDIGKSIAVDANSDAFITGSTTSADFPTVNAFESFLAGRQSAFITELSPDGSTLLYSSYLGGSGTDTGNGIALDPNGNAYITGTTTALDFANLGNDFPTRNAFQPFASGATTAFVAEFNPTLTGDPSLVYSTYLGGSGGDFGNGIAVDAQGNAYVTGTTTSLDFPTTLGSFLPFFTSRNVFQSTDGANSWVNRGQFVPTSSLIVDPTNPTTLYAGSKTNGVFQSTDGGFSFNLIDNGLTNTAVQALAIDPTNPLKLYAGAATVINNGIVTSGGVFTSLDGGADWSPSSTGLSGPSGPVSVSALLVDPANPNTLYAGTDIGVFKRTSRTASWQAIDVGLPSTAKVTSLILDQGHPSFLYVAISGKGIFRSLDGGATWRASGNGLPLTETVTSLAKDPVTATLYAATLSDGVFKSVNAGETWTAASNGLPSSSPGFFDEITSLVVTPGAADTVYAGTPIGVFKSTDGGNSWFLANFGLPAIPVSDLVVDPTNPTTLYVTTTQVDPDAFVAKLDPTGSQIVYATYLGGSGADFGNAIAISTDPSGNTFAYVTGSTNSSDFPILVAAQPFFGQGGSNAFVTEFSPDGSAQIFSTYLGGSGTDSGNGIAADCAGNVYVTGVTTSVDFPIFQPLLPNGGMLTGTANAFVTVYFAGGNPYAYSTYVGGSASDAGNGIAVDENGSVFVTGSTTSVDFPITPGSFQQNLNGSGNAFVAKIAGPSGLGCAGGGPTTGGGNTGGSGGNTGGNGGGTGNTGGSGNGGSTGSGSPSGGNGGPTSGGNGGTTSGGGSTTPGNNNPPPSAGSGGGGTPGESTLPSVAGATGESSQSSQSPNASPSQQSTLNSELGPVAPPINLGGSEAGPAPPHELGFLQSVQFPAPAYAILPTHPDAGGSFEVTIIRGKVFVDYNGNGIPDQGEPGVAGQIVYLESKDGTVFDREQRYAVTNDKGEYEFRDIRPGIYEVRQVIRPYLRQTSPANNGGRTVKITKQKPRAIDEDFGAILIKPRKGQPMDDAPEEKDGKVPDRDKQSRLDVLPDGIDTADSPQPIWGRFLAAGALIVPWLQGLRKRAQREYAKFESRHVHETTRGGS
jgi:hypothetical protein